MPIPVRLPPDTEYIRICDVPNLLAGARYPELPPDTPRRFTEIKKYPIDDDLRREWCGNIIPFGVTLTDADWALLNSIWADLPPLHLPIPENEWQPYQDAFDAANIEGWRLDLMHKSDFTDSLMQRHKTAKALLKVLQVAAERRDFSPLCSVSYTPIDCSSGERFIDSWMKACDLAAFAAKNGFIVEIDSLSPQPDDVPLGPDESLGALAGELAFNGELIDWEYWGEVMPRLNASQASLLMCGLDPLKFKDGIDSVTAHRPAARLARCEKMLALANAQSAEPQPACDWLAWADKNGFNVHEPFRTTVTSHNTARLNGRESYTGNVTQTRKLKLQSEQEDKIIEHIKHELKLNPIALPKRQAGKAGTKSAVRNAIQSKPECRQLFVSVGRFDKAWERLRKQKKIIEVN